jgi:hypothetical protein
MDISRDLVVCIPEMNPLKGDMNVSTHASFPFSSLYLSVPITNTMPLEQPSYYDNTVLKRSSFSLHHAFFRVDADGAGRNPAHDYRDDYIHY